MSLRRLLKSHLAPHRRAIVLVLILQAGQTTTGLLLPGLNATLIDDGVLLGDQSVIWRMGGIMLLVSFIQVVLLTGAVWYASEVAMAFGRDIRRDVFDRVTRYSTREIGRFGTPSLITRITNDTHQIQTLTALVGTMMITAPLTMAAGTVLAIRTDAGLSVLLLVVVPLEIVVAGSIIFAMNPAFQQMQERIDRINAVLREQITGVRVVRAFTREPTDPVRDFAQPGTVQFQEVGFRYPGAEHPVLEAVSFTAAPGETTAIIGSTGAGKTTLVNLLLRFYELDSGRVTLDGVDITAIPRRELRSKFGMVLQDTWLFGDTIWENLRYGNPDATDAQIIEAARVTYVDRFVHSLPEGYDTVINDEGDNISAGQKQLLTIARAFLADPAILILDEATSSVDTRTEVLIQEAMNALRADRTSFVIAHRLSTIRGADAIVVMDGGRIAEQGSHDELLARGGPYANLHAAQFAGQAT